MIKKIFILSVFSGILLLTLDGCVGKQCLKFDGTYKDFSGGVEYCWDKIASEETGRPVLTNSDSKVIVISERDAEKILEEQSVKKLNSNEPKLSPFLRISKILEK